MLSLLTNLNIKWIGYGFIALAIFAYITTTQIKISNLKTQTQKLKNDLNISEIQVDTLRNALILQNKQIEILRLDEKNALNNYKKQVEIISTNYNKLKAKIKNYDDGNCSQKLQLLENTIDGRFL